MNTRLKCVRRERCAPTANITNGETATGWFAVTDSLGDGVSQLEYENVEDWKTWLADFADDLSVIVPKGASADVTVTVEVDDAE